VSVRTQKLVWREDDRVRTAYGRLNRIEGDLIFFDGELGEIIIPKASLIAIK
jgi:hypothetical protein